MLNKRCKSEKKRQKTPNMNRNTGRQGAQHEIIIIMSDVSVVFKFYNEAQNNSVVEKH